MVDARSGGPVTPLRAGTVGHNAYRGDFILGFGGFKQSGVGREGGAQDLRSFLESKAVIPDEWPSGYQESAG